MLPYNRQLVGTKDIANSTGLNHRYVTNVLTKKPGFPAPEINLSQKTRRWNIEKVKQFLKLETRKNS